MKKFLAMVTLVCMVLTSTAFAQSFPSKTAQDMTIVRYEHEEADGWSIYVTEPTELIEEEVKLMGEHVVDAPIVTFFDKDVQEAIPEFKPEVVEDVNELVAYELVAVACDGYQPEFGDAYAYFTFATVYEEGSEVTVMLGLPKEVMEAEHVEEEPDEENDDLMAWSVQKCVVENGEICIKFLQEELLKMEEKIPALVLVLSAELTMLAEELD